jgi:hypothetical protein
MGRKSMGDGELFLKKSDVHGDAMHRARFD